MRRLFSFIAGALVGGLIGAAVALLLTPVAGKDIQTQIRERAEYIQLEVQKAASERRSELEQQLTSLRTPHKK